MMDTRRTKNEEREMMVTRRTKNEERERDEGY